MRSQEILHHLRVNPEAEDKRSHKRYQHSEGTPDADNRRCHRRKACDCYTFTQLKDILLPILTPYRHLNIRREHLLILRNCKDNSIEQNRCGKYHHKNRIRRHYYLPRNSLGRSISYFYWLFSNLSRIFNQDYAKQTSGRHQS